MSIKLGDFDLFRDLLYKESGLVVTPDKTYLLESRLLPVAKKWNFASLEAVAVALRALPDRKLIDEIVDAMTTNETSFFRDQKPFQMFEQTILPALLASSRVKASKKIRIWSAAASTGQESYTLSMLLKEKEALWRGHTIEIVGTDISESALAMAREGAYSQFEVQRGLPITLLMKYFKQVGDKWMISDDIKKMVKFSNFNLLNDMKALGTFDIIFCRNVLIYFDEKTKGQILARMSQQIQQDGFLFLGGAETTLGITDKFKPLETHRGLYVRPDFPGMPAGIGAAPAPSPTLATAGTTAPGGLKPTTVGTIGR